MLTTYRFSPDPQIATPRFSIFQLRFSNFLRFPPSELGEGPLLGVYWPRQIQGGSHELVVAP